MAEVNLPFLRSLKGHNIEYIKDGKRKYGVLEDLAYTNTSDELHAHIRTTGKKAGILYRQFCVPVSKIPKSHFNTNTVESNADKKSDEKNKPTNSTLLQKPPNSRPKATECITHEGFVYTSVNSSGLLESGDEVIWMISPTEKWEQMEGPKGKIDFVGRCDTIFCDKGKKSLGFIALVRFEQDTEGLPHFVNGSHDQSRLNCNVVPLNQLVLYAHYKQIIEKEKSRPGLPFKPVLLKRTGPGPRPWERSSSLNKETSAEDNAKAELNRLDSQEDKVKHRGDDEWMKIDASILFSESADNLKTGRFGIQGSENSCYMDASIYSLFAFTNVLDSFLVRDKEKDIGSRVRHKLKKILRRQIVHELRKDHFVSIQSMSSMRKILEAEVSIDYKKSCMDVEEFMTDLFTLIGAPDLFEYDDKETDSIHQIILPLDWAGKKDTYMSVQELLEGSFEASEIKLARVPEKAFILKMPVSDGKLIPCDGVIPDLALDLSKIVQNGETKSSMQLHLHAVICLRHSHFVTFVRANREDPKDIWVFMDSKPVISRPEVILLQDISSIITRDAQGEQSDMSIICNDIDLYRDAYICIYIP